MSSSERSVHFIRHAESIYNKVLHSRIRTVDIDSTTLIDAALTEKGKQQAKDAKHKIKRLDIGLAISSPYTRAISTCLLAHGHKNVLITPLCGESFEAICDIGTLKEELEEQYPELDFSYVDDDVWWFNPNGLQDLESVVKWYKSPENHVEPDEIVKERAERFYQFLLSRPEKNIAVFSHSQFLRKFLHWRFGREDFYVNNAEVLSFSLP